MTVSLTGYGSTLVHEVVDQMILDDTRLGRSGDSIINLTTRA